MLYIRSLERIYLLTGSLYPLTNLTSFPPYPISWQPPIYSVSKSFGFLHYTNKIIHYLSFSDKLFSTAAVPFYISITNVWGLQFPHTLSNTCYCSFVSCYLLVTAHFSRLQFYPIGLCVYPWHQLIDTDWLL